MTPASTGDRAAWPHRVGTPWLGRSPEPGVEFTGTAVRLRQDSERRDGPVCEIPVADLAGHLEGVRQDLIGFLDLVRRWAPDGLGEAFRRGLSHQRTALSFVTHNVVVIEMSAVTNAHHLVQFPDWPTGPYSDGDVVLSGRMSREDVGTALAALAQSNNGQKVEPDGPSMLGLLLTKEKISAGGGLTVRDTETGVEIEPGCCLGLETWRDWQYLLDGRTPWLGHEPWPEVRFEGGKALLWPDSGDTAGPACVIPIAELPVHLAVVRQDLIGFLDLVRKWAPYGMGEELAERFDQHLGISAPL